MGAFIVCPCSLCAFESRRHTLFSLGYNSGSKTNEAWGGTSFPNAQRR